MDPNFRLETPRLCISHFSAAEDSHCNFLYTLYNSPLFVAAEGKTGITSVEKARERIAGRFLEEHQRNGYGTYLVSLKPFNSDASALAAATPIGTVSLMRGDMLAPDVGFAILPEENGKGYATEASAAIIEYARKELSVGPVLGFANPENPASRRVMEKLGFEDLGVVSVPAFGGHEAQVFISQGTSEDLRTLKVIE